MARSAARSVVRLIAIVIAMSVMATKACRSNSGENDRDDDERPDVARYVAEGDEGLGISVAILLDNSGSMEDQAEGDSRPKYLVAREAIDAMLAATDSLVARQPDLPVNVGLYSFARRVRALVPIKRYDREALHDALMRMEEPEGGTAIGDAMDSARADLYRAGTIRKYILVVTDGENTNGRSPRRVAREIAERSEGAVRMHFVAFDIDEKKFAFLKEVRGEVVGAANGDALRTNLDAIYRGKILAEAIDAGETLPDSLTDSARSARRSRSPAASDTSQRRVP
jgi:hypothetical protein